MSRVDDLLQRRCPDGVQSFKLGGICTVAKGKTAIQKATPGDYPLVVTAKERKTSDAYQFDSPAVCVPLVSSKGHGIAKLKQLHYQEGKFALGNILCAVQPNDPAQVSAKYLYHYLDHNKDLLIVPLMRGGANVALHPKSLLNVVVPVPPLEVQQEIVCVLDAFTELEANLQRELDARKRQYEHYRDVLINRADAAVTCRLEEAASIRTGSKPTEILEEGDYPYINAGTSPSGCTNDWNEAEGAVTTPSRGQGGIGFVGIQQRKFWCGPLCHCIRPNFDIVSPLFLYFYLCANSSAIINCVNEGGTPAVNKKDLARIELSLPTLEMQQEIVAKLDAMVALQDNLQRQIDLTHKQYEHYRDALLDLPRKEA